MARTRRNRRLRNGALLALGLPLLAAPALAAGADLRAVIAVSDPQRAVGASALSRAAMARGADARRLEAPAPEALSRAISDARSAEGVMILALSAPTRSEAGATLLYGFGATPLPLDRLLDDLLGAVPPEDPEGEATPSAAEAVRVVVMLDACATDPASRTAAVAPRPGLALALLPAPDAACPTGEGSGGLAALATALGGQGDLAALSAGAGAVWLMQPGAVLPDLRPPSDAPRVPAPAPTQISAVASAATGGDIILLPRGPATGRTVASAGAGVMLASAAPAPLGSGGIAPGQLAARPTAPGMPEPSIIVGSLRPPPEETGTLGALTGGALGTGLEDRQRLRSEDPELYANLVSQGTFDPEPGALTAAIQTELSRMRCYNGGVDGSWGNGSRAGVDAYFRQAGGQPVTREPEIGLFRQIIAGSDVTCPAPAAPARAAPAAATARSAPATPSRTAPAAGASRAPAAQAPAQQAPAQAPSLGNALRGTGIIR